MQKVPVEKRALLIGAFIIILFISCIAACFLIKRHAAKLEHPVAYLYSEGSLLQTIDLSTVQETYTLVIHTKDNGENIVEVRPGAIGIISASCPDKLCVHQGFISTSLYPIVCLPNEFAIEIKESSNTGLDAVVY